MINIFFVDSTSYAYMMEGKVVNRASYAHLMEGNVNLKIHDFRPKGLNEF